LVHLSYKNGWLPLFDVQTRHFQWLSGEWQFTRHPCGQDGGWLKQGLQTSRGEEAFLLPHPLSLSLLHSRAAHDAPDLVSSAAHGPFSRTCLLKGFLEAIQTAADHSLSEKLPEQLPVLNLVDLRDNILRDKPFGSIGMLVLCCLTSQHRNNVPLSQG